MTVGSFNDSTSIFELFSFSPDFCESMDSTVISESPVTVHPQRKNHYEYIRVAVGDSEASKDDKTVILEGCAHILAEKTTTHVVKLVRTTSKTNTAPQETFFCITNDSSNNIEIQTIEEANEKAKRIFSKMILKNLTHFESHLLSRLFTDSDENKKKLSDWLHLILTDPKEGGLQVKKEVQEFLNTNIHLKDAIKIGFHEGLEKWNKATVKGRAKLVTKEVSKVALGPLILLYKGAKTLVKKEDREHASKEIKRLFSKKSPLNYRDKSRLAKLVLNLGIGGLISSTVAAEVLSLGLVTPIVATFGALALTGVIAKIAIDVHAHKSAVLTIGELIGDTVTTSAKGAAFGALMGGAIHLGALFAESMHHAPIHGGEEGLHELQEFGFLGAKGAKASEELLETLISLGGALAAIEHEHLKIDHEAHDDNCRLLPPIKISLV